ncbi:hypothetical protein AB0D74_10960 [Streptomyces sp. NPDC048278]|uniref:hypothetical protein n=1 Tax=Streptomyces sp. NPDC048278 TaxID=3155809 RepID=UPI003429EB8D
MESAELDPLPEVRPSEEDWRSEDDEDDDDDDDDEVDEVDEVDESELEELGELDELSVSEVESEVVPELLVLDVVVLPLLAVVSASACIVPTRANTPAAAASVTAAARAAVRRVPRRTAATAPLSPDFSPCTLSVMTDPLLRDSLSRITFGYRPERSL